MAAPLAHSAGPMAAPAARLRCKPFAPAQPACSCSRAQRAGAAAAVQQRSARSALPPPSPRLRRGLRAAAADADAAAAPATPGAGRMTYRPESYAELVSDAAGAMLAGIQAGLTRMEVEFPPIPTTIDAYKGSSDLFIDSNVQLALAAAKLLAAAGKRVHIALPDLGEYARSYKIFKPSLEAIGGNVTMGHLKEVSSKSGGVDLLNSWQSMFSGGAPDSAPAAEAADVFIVTNATGVELPNMEAYSRDVVKGRAMITWNLELDTLRGDLGLLGYPPKDMHYRFLSTFRPVFFLRPRDYSKSVPIAPFIVNYSGALFREFPGPWQVMIKQDNGIYACIAEDAVRYNLGEVKEELQAAMGLNTEEKGSVAALIRSGYKTSTWFEDDTALEQSKEWRL